MRTGRPRKLPKDSTVVNIAVPDEVLAALDEWVAELRSSVPGGEGISRADLMRDVLRRAVAERATSRKEPSRRKADHKKA